MPAKHQDGSRNRSFIGDIELSVENQEYVVGYQIIIQIIEKDLKFRK